MESDSTFSKVVDSETGTTFAVLVASSDGITAHGSMKQGVEWATWVNRGEKSMARIVRSLDPSLEITKFVPLNEENILLKSSSFGTTTAKELRVHLERKSLGEDLTKAADPTNPPQKTNPEGVDEHQPEPEYESLSSWMMSDVAVSEFDVQIKQTAVHFKAMQFMRNRRFSSFLLSVKQTNASLVNGSWATRPSLAPAMGDVLNSYDRKTKLHASESLGLSGYFNKALPIGMRQLPPPHLVRNADNDAYIYEGIPWINRGRGILDPTPGNAASAIRSGVRAFGGRMTDIVDRTNRISRLTRNDAERMRRLDLVPASNDIASLLPQGEETRAAMGRMRRRLASLADSVAPSERTRGDGEEVLTRRQARRNEEALARAGINPSATSSPDEETASAGMRKVTGDDPQVPEVVNLSERRNAQPDTELTGLEETESGRVERGAKPRSDGNGMLKNLLSRLSRGSKRINSADSPNPPELDESDDLPDYDGPQVVKVSDDPWQMDPATRDMLLAALKDAVPAGTYATFSSRFGEDDLDWPNFSPSEQSSLLRELGYRRDELLDIVTELMTPEFSADKDYRSDGVVTPESVIEAIRNDFVSLRSGGVNLYADVMALVAINDILSSKDHETEARASAWRMIDNRNRSVVSRRADIQRRDVREASSSRISGPVGERTVISQTGGRGSDSSVRRVALSKLNPRVLVLATVPVAPGRLLSDYSDEERAALLSSATQMRASIAEHLARKMGLPSDTELSEDVIANWMANNSDTDGSKIGVFAHNLIVLDDLAIAVNSGKPGNDEWNALTMPARDKIISNANVGSRPEVAKTNQSQRRRGRPTKSPAPPLPPTPPNQTPPQTPAGRTRPQIGMTPPKNRIADWQDPTQPVPETVDASTQMVTIAGEDGAEKQVLLSSLGRPNQYDFSNTVSVKGISYVMENQTGLYRDPVTGLFLDDYSGIPITLGKTVPRPRELEQVNQKRGAPTVSYPSIQLSEKNSQSRAGLNGEMTMLEAFAQVFGLDKGDAESLKRTKLFLAPGVSPGTSMETFRQAALLFLMTKLTGDDIPKGERPNIMFLDVVDIPEGSDLIESYLRHVGREEVAAAYVAGGRDPNFLEIDSTNGDNARQAANLTAQQIAPPHLAAATKKRDRWSRHRTLNHIFGRGENDDDALVPGLSETDKPRVGKFIYVFQNPSRFSTDGYSYARNNDQSSTVNRIATKVNKAILTDDPNDWFEAFDEVVSAYTATLRKRDAALSAWRGAAGSDTRSNRPRREFVLMGEMAESLETILAEVFSPNMHKVENALRLKKSTSAKYQNYMGNLRRTSRTDNLRNVTMLDDSELAPPTNADGSPAASRGPGDIIGMVEAHQALGFVPHVPMDVTPTSDYALVELSDRSIETLAVAHVAMDTLLDPETGQPVFEVYTDVGGRVSREDSGRRRFALHNALYHLAGWKGRPLLVTEDEFQKIVGSSQVPNQTENVDRQRHVPVGYLIRRGISQAKSGKSTHQMARELISGTLYIPLEGGDAGGKGLNFARPNQGMTSFGGTDPMGDIILAAIPSTARVASRTQMGRLQDQLMDMYMHFFDNISHYSGIEKTMPIDLDADNDPDWSHDNRVNPYWRSNRENAAAAYYVPWGGIASPGRSGVAPVNNVGAVDASDPEALRDLARMVMAAAAQGTYGEAERVEGDPLGGGEWWNMTRAQVFGWMVQMEILKSMEIAALKAAGKVPWNEKIANLVRAQEILSFRGDELIQGIIFGIDAYGADIDTPTTNNAVLLRGGNLGNHLMILNRTAIVFMEQPVTQTGEQEVVDGIRNPLARDPKDPSRVWNPWTNQFIKDPDYNGGDK